jgi:quercetin dioxygenase-like cupin family protein
MEESMKQGVTFLGALVIAGAAYAVGFAQGSAPLTSAVVPMSKTTIADSGAWGAFHKHLSGPTAATADVLSGVVELKAGSEPHPPHQHVDEEFLYVLEGSGTWFLNGRRFRRRPATCSTRRRTTSTASGPGRHRSGFLWRSGEPSKPTR